MVLGVSVRLLLPFFMSGGRACVVAVVFVWGVAIAVLRGE